MSGSMGGLGIREQGEHGMHKIASHHQRHSDTGFGMWWQAYSLGNFARNSERGRRNAQPSQYMNVMCWRVP